MACAQGTYAKPDQMRESAFRYAVRQKSTIGGPVLDISAELGARGDYRGYIGQIARGVRVHYSAVANSMSPNLNLRGLESAEWQMLLECASPAGNDERLADLTRTVDWTEVLRLAVEHGVHGHLAVRLDEL